METVADLLAKLGLKDGPEYNEEYDGESGPEMGTEMAPEMAQDPEPSPEINVTPIGDAPKRRGRPPKTAGGTRVSSRPTSLEKEVTAELTAYGELLAFAWSTRDEQCAGVLSEQSEEIAKRIARILRRYPHLMGKFHASGLLGDWIGLGMALAPVLRTIWTHHVVSAGEEDSDHDDTTGTPWAERYPAFTGIPRAGAVG